MNNRGQAGAIFLGVLAVLIVFGLIVVGIYNGLVSKDVDAQTKWGNVQSAYQRRADLIPNLMATVQGAANFESKTQTEIAKLRTDASNVQSSVKSATTPEQLQAADKQIPGLISRINVVVEAYPDLKATQNFKDFQTQLEGTENRIQFERNNYNTAVQAYATSVRSFPTNILANMFGFSIDKWKTFQAEPGAETAPKVAFT